MSLDLKVREHLTDNLRKPEYRGHPNPVAGHCYVASEAFFHLAGGKAAGLTVCRFAHEGTTHWFLEDAAGGIIDLTADQFQTEPRYDQRVRTGFLTKHPSMRARILMERVRVKSV